MRSLLLGPIVDRIGETWAMRIGTGLLVMGLALYPLPRDLWTLALVIPGVPDRHGSPVSRHDIADVSVLRTG